MLDWEICQLLEKLSERQRLCFIQAAVRLTAWKKNGDEWIIWPWWSHLALRAHSLIIYGSSHLTNGSQTRERQHQTVQSTTRKEHRFGQASLFLLINTSLILAWFNLPEIWNTSAFATEDKRYWYQKECIALPTDNLEIEIMVCFLLTTPRGPCCNQDCGWNLLFPTHPPTQKRLQVFNSEIATCYNATVGQFWVKKGQEVNHQTAHASISWS